MPPLSDMQVSGSSVFFQPACDSRHTEDDLTADQTRSVAFSTTVADQEAECNQVDADAGNHKRLQATNEANDDAKRDTDEYRGERVERADASRRLDGLVEGDNHDGVCHER